MQPELLQYVTQQATAGTIHDPCQIRYPVAPSMSILPLTLEASCKDSDHSAVPARSKRDREIDESCDEAFEQEQKRIRLEVFDPILEAFNTGDIDKMSSLISSACQHDVKVAMPQCATHQGVTPILVLWGLLHETFPDAMTKILEKRISSNASSTHPIQRVEYVYKLQGTGITNKPVMESFTHIMASIGDSKDMSHDDVISVISRHMATIPPHSCDDHTSTFIAETILTFDNDNKIIEWSHDILACC